MRIDLRLSDGQERIARRLIEAGGRPFAVGGSVRDGVLGLEPKDIDIEVFGIEIDLFAELMVAIGAKFVGSTEVGNSFPVWTVEGLDISLPRTEVSNGDGTKDFETMVDPFIEPKVAASRRDFTFNGLMLDLVTGDILDFFGGVDDLTGGRLVALPAFEDDPLRVLRGMQFCGRFELEETDAGTIDRAWRMGYKFTVLPAARIGNEFWKLFSKSVRPSLGIDFLFRCGWIEHFRSIQRLAVTNQDASWHPEGTVLVHTLQVIDQAANLAKRAGLNQFETGILVAAALFHDIGKPETTSISETSGRITAHGHEGLGADMFADHLAAEFGLTEIPQAGRIVKAIEGLIRWHGVLTSAAPNKRLARKLAKAFTEAGVRPELWGLLCEADKSGRHPLPPNRPAEIDEMIDLINQEMDKVQPILLGRHLIERGLQPGPEFGHILRNAMAAQETCKFDDLSGALEWLEWFIAE